MIKEISVVDPLELTMVQLAREIAMDIQPIEVILKHHNINDQQWFRIQSTARFRQLLESETAAWNAALNTQERVKLKAGAMLEEFLPELNARIHDAKETLTSKMEGAKLVARLAGAGLNGFDLTGAGGERFSVTINLGNDQKLNFTKEITTPKVIEHEAS